MTQSPPKKKVLIATENVFFYFTGVNHPLVVVMEMMDL